MNTVDSSEGESENITCAELSGGGLRNSVFQKKLSNIIEDNVKIYLNNFLHVDLNFHSAFVRDRIFATILYVFIIPQW
jgi:hypothetical protein